MTIGTLTRIHRLAEAKASDLHSKAAQVLRQMTDKDKDPAQKAHAITGALMKLTEQEKETVLSAVESITSEPQT